MKKFITFLQVNWFKLAILILLVMIASSIEELEDTQQAMYYTSSNITSSLSQ
jgi:hypothetical protein